MSSKSVVILIADDDAGLGKPAYLAGELLMMAGVELVLVRAGSAAARTVAQVSFDKLQPQVILRHVMYSSVQDSLLKIDLVKNPNRS